jgi:hypothetical protein
VCPLRLGEDQGRCARSDCVILDSSLAHCALFRGISWDRFASWLERAKHEPRRHAKRTNWSTRLSYSLICVIAVIRGLVFSAARTVLLSGMPAGEKAQSLELQVRAGNMPPSPRRNRSR